MQGPDFFSVSFKLRRVIWPLSETNEASHRYKAYGNPMCDAGPVKNEL